ncbi:Protein of unknown function [Pyronema omphalodes CBS 100304]|uniref:Uncharacterized protein n=1 Tax=Pyronema omphalodes (strain CBS 100304) TaxID=1076935 RepID=U4LNU1_PYROM|nr:Protein of unknown function [Pyronema omphalodes CBS 100304]
MTSPFPLPVPTIPLCTDGSTIRTIGGGEVARCIEIFLFAQSCPVCPRRYKGKLARRVVTTIMALPIQPIRPFPPPSLDSMTSSSTVAKPHQRPKFVCTQRPLLSFITKSSGHPSTIHARENQEEQNLNDEDTLPPADPTSPTASE